MPITPRFFHASVTATNDNSFQVVSIDKWFEFLDVFVFDQNAYMGDVFNQDVTIVANDIYYFPTPVNGKEVYFKNIGAGLNARVVFVGVELSDARKKVLGIPLQTATD
jgi:hypothetical protein